MEGWFPAKGLKLAELQANNFTIGGDSTVEDLFDSWTKEHPEAHIKVESLRAYHNANESTTIVFFYTE